MTNIVQETLSINEDDLRRTSPTPLYPVGIIYTVMDDPTPEPSSSRPLSKYIYLKTLADSPLFQPYVIRGFGFPSQPWTVFPPIVLSKPGHRLCVPQEIVRDGGAPIANDEILAEHFAFFLLSGRGKAKINVAGSAGDYYTAQQSAGTEFQKQGNPTQYGNQTHMSLVSTGTTNNVTVDIVLFDKLGEVLA